MNGNVRSIFALAMVLVSTGLLVVAASAQEPGANQTPAPHEPLIVPDLMPQDKNSVLSKSAALDLAGAFANDGYKIRDGGLISSLEPNGSTVVTVNLFVGNEYWFVAAGDPTSRKIDVTVFDEQGNSVSGTSFSDSSNGARAAAGYIAPVTGTYYIRIRLLDGEAGKVFLLYCYK